MHKIAPSPLRRNVGGDSLEHLAVVSADDCRTLLEWSRQAGQPRLVDREGVDIEGDDRLRPRPQPSDVEGRAVAEVPVQGHRTNPMLSEPID